MYLKMKFLGVSRVNMSKYCVLTLNRHYTLREYASVGVSHVKIGSTADL